MNKNRRAIERAANAIRFLVPIDRDCEIKNGALTNWTPKGLVEVKWPRDFGSLERKLIRTIARTVINAAAAKQRPAR